MTRMIPWEVVDGLRQREGGRTYGQEPYQFVNLALQITAAALPRERQLDDARRHLSGRELLEGVVQLARSEFGPLAATVFQEWGLDRSEDIGRIVFQMVEAGLLSARPEDTMADFSDEFDLSAALSDRMEFGPIPRAPRPGQHR